MTGVNLWVDGGWMLTWVSGSIDGVRDWGIWESAQGGLYLNDSEVVTERTPNVKLLRTHFPTYPISRSQ